jgi:hypothetical protein
MGHRAFVEYARVHLWAYLALASKGAQKDNEAAAEAKKAPSGGLDAYPSFKLLFRTKVRA